MQYLDINDLDNLPDKRIIDDNATFSFQCHPNIDCFNLCCRNLNLFLYPYDVIRLKNCLGISSDEFLDRYVDIVLRHSAFFPETLLRMLDNEEKTCPFLCKSGCSVYSDRPDTCRTFPIEQGSFYDSKNKTSKIVNFFRPPDFCKGQYESKKWTTKTWAEDQNAFVYNQMTAKWAELKSLFQTDPWGKQGPNCPKGKMAFMAAYNIDMFRDFVFKSSFLKRYVVPPKTRKKIGSNDMELMKFAFEWIKFYLWNISAKHIKPRF